MTFVTLDGCQAEQNDGVVSSNQYELVHIVPGFEPNPTNVNILNSLAIADPTQPNSIGIFMQNTLSCVVEKNLIENGVLAGIYVTGSCLDNNPSVQNIIKYNQIIAPNTLFLYPLSQQGQYGIFDDSTGSGGISRNIYYGNAAFNFTTNYSPRVVGASAVGTYIVSWTPPAAQPTNVTTLSNLDVQQAGC